MFKKVVWATDGSKAADQTLPLVRELARMGGGEVVVVHCGEMTAPSKGAEPVPAHVDETELLAKIRDQVADLSNDGVRATLELAKASTGGAAHAIADAAEVAQAEVIVVGTRGHTALGGLLLGSVTQRLLHIAPCPVLAVPIRSV